jgi:DNA-binding transcriptional MerR regulator
MRPQASPRIEQLREQDQHSEKSNRAFRTISEVAEVLDTPAHVLRFWESKFSQIKPMKRGGGRRYYRPEDVSLLRGIKELLYVDGLTIKGVQKVLRERGQKHVAGLGVDEVAPTDVTDTLARLEELSNRLKAG